MLLKLLKIPVTLPIHPKKGGFIVAPGTPAANGL